MLVKLLFGLGLMISGAEAQGNPPLPLSTLPSATTMTSGDLFYTVQSGNSAKTTAASIATFTSNNLFNAINYGADPTGATDSTTAIQNCLTAAGATTVKGTCVVGGGKFQVLSSINIPRGATLSCGDSFYDQEDNPANYASMPAILLASTATIGTLGPSATIKNCLIYRNGMTFPAANSSAFAGIAVQDSNGRLTVKDSIFLGFDTAIYIPAGDSPWVYHVIADCTGITHACIDFEFGNTDSGVIRDVKIQPAATGNSNCTNSVRAGTGLRLGGGGGPVASLDELIVQNFQVAQYDLEAFTEIGHIWADNINGTAVCGGGGFGTSICVKIGAGASVVASVIEINACQTGMQILSNGATSYVGAIAGACFGQDIIQLGDATHSGNLQVGQLNLNGAGCSGAPASTARYGINVLHSAPFLMAQQAFFTSLNSGAAPYFQSTGVTALSRNLGGGFYIQSLQTDLTLGTNPWAPNFVLGPGSGDMMESFSAILGSCTGLGAQGTCAGSSTNGLQGFVVLSPSGTASITGTVSLSFPLLANNGAGYACAAGLSGSSGTWSTSATVQPATITGNTINLNWFTGANLVSGSTYRVSYLCRPQ